MKSLTFNQRVPEFKITDSFNYSPKNYSSIVRFHPLRMPTTFLDHHYSQILLTNLEYTPLSV